MNTLTPELLTQLFARESNDPFLTLLTLSHSDFSTIRFVNNTENITSRGNTFVAFPFKIRLPIDDGETGREVSLEFDNVSLSLVDEIRSVTTPINCTVEMVLASRPNEVQIAIEELKVGNVSYNKKRISARLYLDNFLNTSLTSERYYPSNFPGLF